MSNKLASEKSPYLLQHSNNPVDWYPWGDEAFEKAHQEDKPVFLSVGYATCHWCHVMAHESFEDEGIAQLMNQAFVNIKVDREERPDIDNTYMTVCQMLTGSGGWPLTIIMTPNKKPFYAATYIPKQGRHGQPGMAELIPRIRGLWKNERDKVVGSSEEIAQAFQKSTKSELGKGLGQDIFEKAYKQYEANFDEEFGGFGHSPKFPSPHNLMLLLRYWNQSQNDQALQIVEKTLTNMRRGGIYDQVGYGFHRYSTDQQWLVPHFEKMLYDQAMLIMAYTEAWQATGKELYRQTAEEIIQYVLRDLQDSEGAFYSAEDADSEGEEGKFYVWSIDEIREALPAADAELAIEVFNMTEEGNYEDEATRQKTGKNIPHLTKSFTELAEERDLSKKKLLEKIEKIRTTLLEAREKRVRPLLDDKVLTDWNGLMIAALAKAGRAFDKQSYIEEAKRALSFINEKLVDGETLLHRYRDGEAAIHAHADDFAFLIWGSRELYESTFEIPFLKQAVELQKEFIDQFWDNEHGGFFFTSHNSEELLGRTKEVYDGALPSGNSVAMQNLLTLGRITGNTDWEQKADTMNKLFSEQVSRAPTGFGQLLQALDFQLGTSFEVTIAGEKESTDTQNMLKELHHSFVPNKIVVFNDPEESRITKLAPYTENQDMKDEKATAYVCKNYSCKAPTNSVKEMMEELTSPSM